MSPALRTEAMSRREPRGIIAVHSLEYSESPEPDLILQRQLTTEKWYEPRGNVARLAATYWCFVMLGANDSSYGVLIPQLEEYYNISYLQISLVLLSPVLGFIMSTLFNHTMHTHLGQRGIAIAAGCCHVAAYTFACLHPPYPAMIFVYILVGAANGAKTGAWNSFVAGLQQPNELLGLLHGFYGLGATLTPVTASSLFNKRQWKWYEFYYLMIGMAVLDFAFSLPAFCTQTAAVYRRKAESRTQTLSPPTALPGATEPARIERRLRKRLSAKVSKTLDNCKTSQTVVCLKDKVVIICSLYLLAYVGCEVALGGWLVTFMVKIRHASEFGGGITSSGLWGGITAGRIALGFVTGRSFRSEKHAVMVYLGLAVVMHLLFWLIPNFVSSAVFVALLGFFLGPLFPAVIVCLSRLVPKAMRVTAIAMCSATGASGASIIPFMVGAIASAKGIRVLQPIVLVFLVLCGVLWIFLPKLPPRT